MKRLWMGIIPVLLGVLFMFSCKYKNADSQDVNNPVFQTTPDLKSLTLHISKDPGNALLFYERGMLLHRLQQDTLALRDLKKATKLDTTKAEYFSAVGDLLFEKKDLNGSVQWLQKAIAIDPNDRKAHLKIAKMFLYIRDYGKAFSEINIVLRQDVYNPEAYFLKGMVYKEMKDTAKAVSSFQTAVQVVPDYRDAIIQLGLIYSARQDTLAVQYLNNAYDIDSTDVFPLFAEGVYYQARNDKRKAKEMYTKCIIKDREYADAYFNMGYILMQEDSTEKAWRQYDIVTKIQPDNPTAYYNRGLCSEIMSKTLDAINDYRQAIALDSVYSSPRIALKRLGVQ